MVPRNNKSVFVKPQIVKLKNLGKTYSEIVSKINSINEDQIFLNRLFHFQQLRRCKVSNVMSNFIYDATQRSMGFISAYQLQFQIVHLFHVLISLKTLNNQRKLLSKHALFKYRNLSIRIHHKMFRIGMETCKKRSTFNIKSYA